MITPRAGRLHGFGHNVLGAQKHAFQVHVDGELPFLERALLQRLVLRGADHVAGVVHEDIDPAELGKHRVDHRLDLIFKAHVALDPECPASRCLGNIRGRISAHRRVCGW